MTFVPRMKNCFMCCPDIENAPEDGSSVGSFSERQQDWATLSVRSALASVFFGHTPKSVQHAAVRIYLHT